MIEISIRRMTHRGTISQIDIHRISRSKHTDALSD
jgi:hypothetical protein